MTIKFVGDKLNVTWIETGFWSFDNACANNRGQRGFAVPAFVEVFAKQGVGKTAFCTTLGGIVAKKLDMKSIAFLDWEWQDFDTILNILERAGFDGELEQILEETDEVSIDKFYKAMKSEKFAVGIMDSIAAFSSIAEEKGHQADAIMGKRALNMSKFSRRIIRNFQLRMKLGDGPGAVFATNHLHPTIGAMYAGTDTAGGETKKYMTTYRILLKKAFYVAKKYPNLKQNTFKFDDGWVLEGKIEKNRTGFTNKTFHVVMMMGEGLHQGLSALWDCLIYDLAKVDRVIKMDGDDYGTMKSFIDNRDDKELFMPFVNKLRSMSKVAAPVDEEEFELVQLDDEDEV